MSEARWIAAEVLPGRERPDASETPSGRVEAGSELTELERLGLWVRVETPDDKRYWVDSRRLTEVAPAPADAVPVEPASEPVPPPTPPPAPPPPVQPEAPAWTATHTVPPEGIQAWAEPDPTGAVTNLAGGVELQVQEHRADWAHVAAQNGWQGWVDGRRLVSVPATASPPWSPPDVAAVDNETVSRKAGPFSIRSVASVAVVITIFLPWFSYGRYFGSGDATDVPAAFLWTLYPDSEFPNMGTVMMIVGAAVLATEFVDRFKPYRRVAAWTTVVVAAVYLVQLLRAFMENEGDFITAVSTMFTEGFAIGPWVALAAGIALLVKQPEDSSA